MSIRGAATVVGDIAGGAAMILCIPLGILAIGIPLALGLRLLMWMARLL
jgi:hypothetical protein